MPSPEVQLPLQDLDVGGGMGASGLFERYPS